MFLISIALRKELENYKEKEAIKNAELKKYEAEKREAVSNIDIPWKCILDYF